MLRTELPRLVDAQAFPGLAHRRAQTRRHGRIGRKGVEFVPLQHVVRQTRRQTRPATAMTQSSTLRKACCEICLTTGKAMQVPRMTPGAPYMAQVSTVGV